MNGLPPRTLGGVGGGIGAGSLGPALPTARAPAGQTLQGDADASTAAASMNSFVAMLSVADACGFGNADEGPGKPAMSTTPSGPDESGSPVDASRDTALAATPDVVVPLPPALPAPFDPALLLAQGALSVQPAAAASAPAASAELAALVATTTAVAMDSNGSSRSATAERFGPPAQRPASMAAGAIVQPPLRALVGAAAFAPAPASAARSFEVAVTSVKSLDLPSFPAASALPASNTSTASTAGSVTAATAIATATATAPIADFSALIVAAPIGAQEGTAVLPVAAITNAAGDAAATADMALATWRVPVSSTVPAATESQQPMRAQPAVVAATTQAASPTSAVGAGGSNALGLAGVDRPMPKPASDEAAQSLPAATRASANEATMTAATVRAAERPARQPPSVASSMPGAVEPQPTKRDAAIEPVLSRTDVLPLAGRIGRDEERRSDGDGIAASGPFALPSALSAASVGPVASGHAAHAGGLPAASVERVVDQVSWWLAQKSGSADFSVDLPGGQALSVSVQVRGNEAQVVFRSDMPELRQLIGQAMPQLKESFGQEGLLLSNASVSAQASPGQGSQSGHASSAPYQPSGRPSSANDRVPTPAERPVAAVATRRVPFGVAGRSLDLYV